MIEKLEALKSRYEELAKKLEDPDIARDQKVFRQTMQEHASLEEVVELYKEYQVVLSSLESTQVMLEEDDTDIKAMAREEIKSLEEKKADLDTKLRVLLIPKDPLDGKNVIVEIRAGTGGDEAGLFAADLYRMYQRYGENHHWKLELLSMSETELGGMKEVVFSVSGKSVYGVLKFESGTHRVQRVPTTENQGRIHTSAVTVAVLPEAEETDIHINDNDLRYDVYRSGGPGGQSVNTTDSAVRITHIPTGLVVICQDEKSQLKNKAKALRVLMARLYEREEARRQAEISEVRKSQIGSGDRSERIRTYNFPQNRLTDHRINLTLYNLDRVMEGELDAVVEALQIDARESSLRTLED